MSRMSRDAQIIMLLDDSLSKVFVFRDIVFAVEEEDMVFKGPFCTSN